MTISDHPLADDLESVLDRTRDLWEEMRGGRVFITGGTGFFGCWLLESFLWANDRLGLKASAAVLTRRPDDVRKRVPHLFLHPAVEIMAGDVRSLVPGQGDFTHVIHAATDSSRGLDAGNALDHFETIVGGTRAVLDFAVAAGAGKLLLTSSGAVYGRQPHDLTHVPEGFTGGPDPADFRSAYGEGKRAAETLAAVRAATSSLQVKMARCFAFVGPYQPLDVHFAVGNFIRDALAGGPVVVRGDGTPFRSYLYAADLAEWLWTILFRGESCRPYNVGSDEALQIGDVARSVAAAIPGGVGVEIMQPPDPERPVERYVPEIIRARSELGLSVHTGFRDAVCRTIRWHQRT